MPLTPEQQSLVRDNIKLAGTIACRYHATNPNIPIEDLFQIASIGLCKAAAKYDPSKGKFSTMAFITMETQLNMFLRQYRRWNKHEAAMLDYETDLDRPPQELADPNDFLDSFEDAELSKWLRRTLAQLPADQQTVVRLKILGHTQRSIGRIFKKSQAWASRKYKEAIITIRQLAVAEGFAPPELLCLDDTERPG